MVPLGSSVAVVTLALSGLDTADATQPAASKDRVGYVAAHFSLRVFRGCPTESVTAWEALARSVLAAADLLHAQLLAQFFTYIFSHKIVVVFT